MSAVLEKEPSGPLSPSPSTFRSKIILRNLPPDATEAQVKQLLQTWLEREHISYFCLHAGRASKRLGGKSARKAYALVSFVHPEALLEFVKLFTIDEDGVGQNLMLTDARGQEYYPSVEFAPSQRLPGPACEPNPRVGTLEDDEDFQRFVAELQTPTGEAASGTYADSQSQVETMLAKERQLHPWKYVKSPETLVPSTPLLEFLAQSKGRGTLTKSKGPTGDKSTGDSKKSKKKRKKRTKKRDVEGTDEAAAVVPVAGKTGSPEAPQHKKQGRRKKRSGDRHKSIVESVLSVEAPSSPPIKVVPMRILTKKSPLPTEEGGGGEGEEGDNLKVPLPVSIKVQGGSIRSDLGASETEAAIGSMESKKQQVHVKKSSNVKITVKVPPSTSLAPAELPLAGCGKESTNRLPVKASMDSTGRSKSHKKESRPSVEGVPRTTSKSHVVKGKTGDHPSASSAQAGKSQQRSGNCPIIRSSMLKDVGGSPDVDNITIPTTSESSVRPAPSPSDPADQSNQSSVATIATTTLRPQPIVYKTIERRTIPK